MNGGSFKDGFLGAGVAALAGLAIKSWPSELQFISRTIIGGIAAEAGGGKFMNGALSAAFAYAFNDYFHEYQRGPTTMCYADQAGCTFSNALRAVDPVSVPFTDNPVEGRMEIGPNNDPIRHIVDRENYTITNIALEGHPYAGGQVVHSLTAGTQLSFSWSEGFYMRDTIQLTTVGTGPNSTWCCSFDSLVVNNLVGSTLFLRTHLAAPILMRQYLGGSP